MKYLLLVLVISLTIGCSSQEQKTATSESRLVKTGGYNEIGNYVTSVFQDSKENLWFGTIEFGIAQYDGNRLKYFTETDGFPSNRITSVFEDPEGKYWFSTDRGISILDEDGVRNIQINNEDFGSNSIGRIYLDSKGTLWIGTWGGVYTYDGKDFTPFQIPYPEVDTPVNQDTKNWITVLTEDSQGNMWFARDGFGATKYDGETFTHYLIEDGLKSNNVTEIEFDDSGKVWFGMRNGYKDLPDYNGKDGRAGILIFDGTNFSEIEGAPDLDQSDIYCLYKDNAGNMWIGTTNKGVFKYDGQEFHEFQVPISIMDIEEDNEGIYWLGGAGGLYKIDKSGTIVKIKQDGPWD